MDQLRDSLSDVVATTSSQVQDTVTSVTDKVASMTDEAVGRKRVGGAVRARRGRRARDRRGVAPSCDP